MKLITIEKEAWKRLNDRINNLADYLQHLESPKYDDLWLNNHEVCQYLHLSKRTLWRMRKRGEITHSKIYGQYFYPLGIIKKFLDANVIQSKDKYINDLMEKGKSYIEKGRKFKSKNLKSKHYEY